MAEFIEVARAKRRMCKTHTGGCSTCKLQKNCSLLSVYGYSDDDVRKLENEVMEWAAEHSEPVYPTWAEYLNSIGVTISDRPFPASNIPVYLYQAGAKMFEPIPADIAQKLGIKPKE